MATIPEEVKQVDYTKESYDHMFAPRLMIDVIGGADHDEHDINMEQAVGKEVIESSATILEDTLADTGNVPDEIIIDEEEEVIELPIFTRQLTHEEMIEAIDRLMTSFGITMVEQYTVIDAYKRLIAARKYPRKS